MITFILAGTMWWAEVWCTRRYERCI